MRGTKAGAPSPPTFARPKNFNEIKWVSLLFPCCPQQEDVRRAHGDAEGEDGQEGRKTGADAPGEGGQAQGTTTTEIPATTIRRFFFLPCADDIALPVSLLLNF